MKDEELKEEMQVLVDFDGGLKQAKVIGPVEERNGNQIKIIGWKLHVGRSALEHNTTADKIYSKT